MAAKRRRRRNPILQALLSRALKAYLHLVHRTTRWTILGEEMARLATTPGTPVILTFWHESLALMSAAQLVARARYPGMRQIGAHVLISRHRDGRLIGDTIERLRMKPVYASSSEGGASGLLALARLLAQGEAVGITPDGPRGPRRVAATGVGQLAGLSGAPVVALAAATTRMKRLRSWDRMRLPLPFARGVISLQPAILVPRAGAEEAHAAIEAAMTAACDEADAWVAARLN